MNAQSLSQDPSAVDVSSKLPLVTIVMPVRNESKYIRRTLNMVLAQDYPQDRIEIIVADGMSNDGTRETLREYEARNANLRVIDNPGQVVPTGLNAAIDQARGTVVLRIDGHVEIGTDFVRESVAVLEEHPDAWCVGGPIVHAGTNLFSKAVAIAMSHPIGVGNATHRFANYDGYGEGAAFPAIRRWAYDRVGQFDESLVRNQDDEWNYRVTQAGGRIYISPRIRYRYFVRDSIAGLFRQYFQYSFWRIPVIRKHKRPTTIRQMIPSLFFLIAAFLLVIGLWFQRPLVAGVLPATYMTILAVISLSIAPRVGLKVAAFIPVAIGTMHLGYGLGMLYGMCAALFSVRSFERHGHMSKVNH